MHPRVAKLLRGALIGSGAMLVTSAVVNVIAAVKLIEPSDEATIGLTRGEVIFAFSGSFLVGAAMIYCGLVLRWDRKPPS
jgi:hypothetical protein